jgi:hypothetical protein
MKNMDPLTLLCKEYVNKKDYWGAYAIIDTIALVNPGKADAMQRAAFHRSIKQVIAGFIQFLGGKK